MVSSTVFKLNWDTRDWEWLAGLYEGEGSVGCYKHTDRTDFFIMVSLTSTDREVLEEVKRIAGGAIYGPRFDGNNRKGIYRWQIGRYKPIVEFYSEIKPYLFSRRQQQFEDALTKYNKAKEDKSGKLRSLQT